MKNKNCFKYISAKKTALILISFVALSIQPKVSVASEYEELTYDDLVTQLSQKRDQSVKQKNFNSISTTYLGLGMVKSFNEIQAHSNNYNANLTGYELSTGTNLRSETLRAEAQFRYFPQTQAGTTTTSLNELGGSIQYRRDLNDFWRSKFFGGMSFRFLNFQDSPKNVDVQETSSMLIAGAGVEAKIRQNVSLGADTSLRFPFFGSSTPDKTSVSFAFKLETSFE